MTVHLPAEPGPNLDHRITRLIHGPRRVAVSPKYSVDDRASESLISDLRSRAGIETTFEQDGDAWYCVFWAARPGDGARERVASGSAPTRSLATCRAVLNLPLKGTGSHLRLRRSSRGWIGPDEELRSVPTGSLPAAPSVDSSGEALSTGEEERSYAALGAEPES